MYRFFNFFLLSQLLLVLFLVGCKKPETNKDIETVNLQITNYNLDTISHLDTFIIKGDFPSVDPNQFEAIFTDGYFYGMAEILQHTDTQITMQVPYLKGEYADPYIPIRVGLTLTAYLQKTTYRATIDTQLTYLPQLRHGFTFGPEKARKGQCITLNINNSSLLQEIQVMFPGDPTWYSPIGYDSFSYNNGSGVYLNPGPIFRIPENAIAGTIEARSNIFALSRSNTSLTVLDDMESLESGVWTQRSDYASRGANRTNLSGGGVEGAASFVIGDAVYVVGGTSLAPFDGHGTNEVWKFEPKFNSWLRVANFPGGPRAFASSFSLNGKGYVGVGENQDRELQKDFWEYNPALNQWTRKADFPGSRRRNAIGFSASNKGYIGTGEGESNYDVFDDIYEYNLNSNSWQLTTLIPNARKEALVFVINNDVYIGGGYSPVDGWLSDFYQLNLSNNQWVNKATLPHQNTSSLATFVINNKGFAGVGRGRIPGVNFVVGSREMYTYDVQNNTWLQVADVGGTDRQYAIGFAVDNVGYIGFGGKTGNTSSQRDLWGYR